MNIDITILMTLIAMASKACEHMGAFAHGLSVEGKEIEMRQIVAMLTPTIDALGKLDKEFPGMLPLPHDGRSWKERAGIK